MRFYFLLAMIFHSYLFASFPTEVSGQMLYLLHKGEIKKAFSNYLNYSQDKKEHDWPLLQQAGIRLLENGIASNDKDKLLMCMFGAGIANSHDLIPILEKGIRSGDQKTELIALDYLSRQEDDYADELMLEALTSNSLLTRLECCYQLAKKNHPSALSHLQSLMIKVPDIIRPLFPQIVVLMDGEDAHRLLKQLLTDHNLEVRIQSILAVAKQGRDDCLTQIRSLITQTHHAQQEACAMALGTLKDSRSIPFLLDLLKSVRREVKLASAISLFELGERWVLELIENEAREKDLFAITALGNLKAGKETLQHLLEDEDRDVRINATLSLLKLNEPVSLEEVLVSGSGDLGFAVICSPGQSMKAWKSISSHHQNKKNHPGIVQQTLSLRESVLMQSLELPEENFLKIAGMIFDKKQTELVPLLVSLLENLHSSQSIDLLKNSREQTGEPLIRHYCTLALYRLKQEGSEQLTKWLENFNDKSIIQFREQDDRICAMTHHYELTPEETSRLLIDTFETLAQEQNIEGTEALVRAIAYGNEKNRYALAGLLIRTTE